MRETSISEGLALQSADIIAEVSAAIDNASEELRRLSLEVRFYFLSFEAKILLTPWPRYYRYSITLN